MAYVTIVTQSLAQISDFSQGAMYSSQKSQDENHENYSCHFSNIRFPLRKYRALANIAVKHIPEDENENIHDVSDSWTFDFNNGFCQ
jgi:hypothetical protein